MQIAKILEIDPLLIFDMDLTYTDKQRLLMKLLFDCTPNISVNSDGHVVAVLPEEFDAFGEMFLTYITVEGLMIQDFEGIWLHKSMNF